MIKQDVKIIKADLTQHEFIYLIPLSDLHIEEPQSDVDAFCGYVDWIKKKKNAYAVLVGDLFTMPTRKELVLFEIIDDANKVGRKIMTPDDALDKLEELLKPISQKIIGACTGGHELKNMFRVVGSDYTLQLMKRLGREDVYARDGGVLKVKVKPLNSRDNEFFRIVFTHGWGGARTRGAKIRKLEYLAQNHHADIYILAHDHTQNLARDNYLEYPGWDGTRAVTHRKLLVSSGSFRGYGGYPFRAGYQPADLGTPRIRIGKKIDENGVVRKDIHASI